MQKLQSPLASEGTPLYRALLPLGAVAAWVVLRPMRFPSLITPAAFGLPFRRLTLESGGTRLAAWHVPRADARAGIVLCHGHNDSRKQMMPLVKPLHDAGFHVLLFDFRGMGLSGGNICTYGHHEQEDVRAAVAWLRREAGVERVGVYGISMGGSAALLAASAEPGITAVAADCAFARLDEMVEQRFAFVPAPVRAVASDTVRFWSSRWCGDIIRGIDPEAAVARWTRRPLFLIHGERDTLTPVQHAHRLASAAGADAEVWIVPRAGHAECLRRTGGEYLRRVCGFFARHLGPISPGTARA